MNKFIDGQCRVQYSPPLPFHILVDVAVHRHDIRCMLNRATCASLPATLGAITILAKKHCQHACVCCSYRLTVVVCGSWSKRSILVSDVLILFELCSSRQTDCVPDRLWRPTRLPGRPCVHPVSRKVQVAPESCGPLLMHRLVSASAAQNCVQQFVSSDDCIVVFHSV